MKKNKISKKYRPTEKEKFMNNKMKEFFQQKLLKWKSELLKGSSETITNLKQSENLYVNLLHKMKEFQIKRD